jgi:hypothetical protein
LQDNAFAEISDWQKAQELSDDLTVTEIHSRMDAAVARYVPDLAPLGRYHWSISQAEYASDIVFRSANDLAPFYDHLPRTAIHVVKFSDIATCLGRSRDGKRVMKLAYLKKSIYSLCPDLTGMSREQPTTATSTSFRPRRPAEILAFLQSIVGRTDYQP